MKGGKDLIIVFTEQLTFFWHRGIWWDWSVKSQSTILILLSLFLVLSLEVYHWKLVIFKLLTINTYETFVLDSQNATYTRFG